MQVVLRISCGPERCIVKGRPPNRRLASGAASLVWPIALACSFTCVWRWAYELDWTGRFLVAGGLLSHWQVWFVAGGLLDVLAVQLTHYGESGQRAAEQRIAAADLPALTEEIPGAIRVLRDQSSFLWSDRPLGPGTVRPVQIP